uniref:ATP synthase complex subunit 8 n=1 Tax=Ophisternon sp. b AFMS-2024 TaxID=3231494 RepID=A0AB39A6G2_9TELE
MPQLNPTPWFFILIFSWFIFLFILMPKIITHTFPNEPLSKITNQIKTEPWNWPWL